MTSKISPKDYVLRFGKYKNMKAIDVADIYEVDKNGKDKATGLMYLKFLTTCEWFKHTAILAEIINIAEECMSDNDDDEKQAEEIPKKKEPKEKKNKKINVKINDPNISKIVDFE